MKRLLFVCTGNLCRSPMAESIFRAKMPAGWKEHVRVSSAGTAAWGGQPASSLAVEVLREEGIDLTPHRARLLTREMIDDADLVVVMERRHGEAIERTAPDADKGIVVLGDLDGGRESPDIDDPIGGDRAVYERTREELKGLIDRLIEYLVDLYDMRK